MFIARDYGLGTAFRMGPAYFPTVARGPPGRHRAPSLARAALRPGEPLRPAAVKGLLRSRPRRSCSARSSRGAGLVVALPVLVVVSAAASARFRWGPALALAAGLTLFCAAVFLKGLGVPLPILGSWLGG